MEPFGPPRPIDAPPRLLSLTGKLVPWEPDGSAPYLLSMPESPAYYLACFPTREALDGLMTHFKIGPYRIKRIEDGVEFRDSIPKVWDGRPLIIIADPYVTERGTVRFTQVCEEEPPLVEEAN